MISDGSLEKQKSGSAERRHYLRNERYLVDLFKKNNLMKAKLYEGRLRFSF